MCKVNAFFKKHKESFYLFGCLALYVILAYLFKIPCPIKKLTGISCPGCGMTRALIALFMFDFPLALYYHPLVFFVIPVLLMFIVFYERNMVKCKRILIVVLVIVLIVVYLYRMIIIQSNVLEFKPENNFLFRFWKILISLFG